MFVGQLREVLEEFGAGFFGQTAAFREGRG